MHPSRELDKNAALLVLLHPYVSWPLHFDNPFAEPSAFKVHTLTFQKTIRRQGMEFENILKFRQKSSHEK